MNNDHPQTGGVPPQLPTPQMPESSVPPPPPPPMPTRQSLDARQTISILLSLCLGLFLADAMVSLLDDSLIVFLKLHVLTGLRALVFLGSLLMAMVVYILIGLTPSIPLRLFLPLVLFNPVAQLAIIPLLIFFYDQIQWLAWGLSFGQVIFGLGMLCRIQGGFNKCRWRMVGENQVETWSFSWLRLSLFAVVNIFVLLPATIAYLVFCTALAVGHISNGFMVLRPEGFKVQVAKYVRHDGKMIQLIPMAHIGESDFYQTLNQSFPSNAIVMMEGVTDNRGLLTNKLSYTRLASTLGLAEQQKTFAPSPNHGKWVRADVDVELFRTNTLNFLNLVTLVHSKGVNARTVLPLLQYNPHPEFQQELLDDVLHKRNRHLLEEINSRLSESQILIVPWGVAHMPELAREIQKSGFRLDEARQYTVIRFGGDKHQGDKKADK